MNRRLTAQTFHIWTRNKHRINLSCPFAVVIACFIALYLTLSSFALTGSQKRISYLVVMTHPSLSARHKQLCALPRAR